MQPGRISELLGGVVFSVLARLGIGNRRGLSDTQIRQYFALPDTSSDLTMLFDDLCLAYPRGTSRPELVAVLLKTLQQFNEKDRQLIKTYGLDDSGEIVCRFDRGTHSLVSTELIIVFSFEVNERLYNIRVKNNFTGF